MLQSVVVFLAALLAPLIASAGQTVESPCPVRLGCHAWIGGVSGQAEVAFQNRTGNYLEVYDDLRPSENPNVFYDMEAASVRATLDSVTCPLDGGVNVTLEIIPRPEYGKAFRYSGPLVPYRGSIKIKRGRLNVACGSITNVTVWKAQGNWRPKNFTP